MRRNYMKAVLIALACAASLVPSRSMAQVSTATISGTVMDSAGAVLPKIKVVATQVATGVRTTSVTNDKGAYELPFLQPGPYKIDVDIKGFKRYIQENLNLTVGDHPTDDIHLQVGDEQQTVTVTDVPVQLATSDDSIGQVVTTAQVESLPLYGRTPMVLAQNTAGVVSTTTPGQVRAFDNSGISAFSVGGLANKNTEILMDGAPDTASDNSIAYSPMIDAVAEVRVHVFESDAEYGHSAGGVANQVTKNGTNRLHGTLSEFNQNSYLNANSYFNDRSNIKKGVSRFNQYGGTVGGPAFIPKLYDGRNKLFFFFGYEGIKDSSPSNQVTSVPTVAERSGDFSALLGEGSQYQMYDPTTATLVNGVVTRTPYANNIIPSSEFSTVGQAILKYYPTPNLTTGKADGTNDYFSTADTGDKYTNELARVDYNLNARNNIFVTFRRNNRLQYVNQVLGDSNPALGDYLSRINTGGTIADVYTIKPTLIGETRLNFTRYVQDQTATGAGFQDTSLGMPGYMTTNSEAPIFPRINMNGIISLGVPTTSYSLAPYNSFSILSDLVKIQGSHTFKVGMDLRLFQKGQLSYGNSQGAFTFDNTWVKQTSSVTASTVTGNDVAALLLGLPTSGTYDVNAASVSSAKYYAFYLQDDWRLRRDLTVNLGLRFDHDSPATERHDRVVNGFDSTDANPISAAAITAYAASPNALLPAASFKVNGGLTFASASNPDIFKSQSYDFSPRIGVSYTPAYLGGNTSIRGGFGLFVQPTVPFNSQVNQEGYSQTSSMAASNNNYLTAAATLSNPFPNGLTAPSGSSLGLATFNGQSLTIFSPTIRNGYSERWNLGVQRQFKGSTLVEVAYIGNHALKLPITQNLNYVNPAYLTTASNPSLTSTTVANPFLGLAPGSSMNTAKTITEAQLLSVYPQFTGLSVQDAPYGSSYYNALDVRVEKRAGYGITATANYQWSKLLERVTYLNAFDPNPEKRISQYDRTNHMVLGLTYEMPFGKGRMFGGHASRILDLPLGGWIVNGVFSKQSGAPLAWGDVVLTGQPISLSNRQVSPGVTALNVAAFDIKAADQPLNHIRTFHTQYSNLRIDGNNDFSASTMKNFNFTEKTFFQLRFEMFNALNRPMFASPNLTPTSSTFGIISGTSNNSRVIQVGGRIVF